MDTIKKTLKYPFKKLYAFGIFALDAKSTSWPGVSRYSIYTLFPALFLNLFQILLTTALVMMLSNLPPKPSPCYPNTTLTSPHPITYASIHTNAALTISPPPNLLIRSLALLTPLSALVALSSTTLSHLSRSRISNCAAATHSFLVLVALTTSAGFFAELWVDGGQGAVGAEWCWVEADEMIVLQGKKAGRGVVWGGVWGVVGGEIIMALGYLGCAVHAARLNRVRARAQGDPAAIHGNAVALRDLLRGDGGDAGAVLGGDVQRNSFEDPVDFVDTAAVVDGAATTEHTQSGHPSDPFSDAHASRDEGVKTSTTVVCETAGDEDPFEDVVAGTSPTARASSDAATPSGAVRSTRNASSISIDTVVEEGWELRSGAVDELSVIAEVDSKDERDADREA